MRELLSESLRGWGDKTVVKQTKKQTNKTMFVKCKRGGILGKTTLI